MENKGGKKITIQKPVADCACRNMFRCSHDHFGRKLFLALVLTSLGLAMALTITYKAICTNDSGKSRWEMMRHQISGQNYFMSGKTALMTVKDGTDVAYKLERQAPVDLQRIFGEVTQVEGNQISIKNNAATGQLVITEMQTIIISASSTEVGVSALRTGQNIVIVGSVNSDNQLVAKQIHIQQ